MTASTKEIPPPEEIRSGGCSLLVRRLGDGDRILFLHGGPGLDHHLLLPLAIDLAERFEVWLPDLPGHGMSHADWKKPPGLKQVIDYLSKWLAGLAEKPDVLAGHSLGAWIARELLRKRKVRPRATVLLSPPAGGRTGSSSPVRRKLDDIPPAVLTRDSGDDLGRFREQLLLFAEIETVGRVTDEFKAAVDSCIVRPPWRYGGLLKQFHRALLKPTPPCDNGPVLVICGDADKTTPPGQAGEVSEATAGSTLEIIPEAGHFPYADGDRKVADRIIRFLEEVLD